MRRRARHASGSALPLKSTCIAPLHLHRRPHLSALQIREGAVEALVHDVALRRGDDERLDAAVVPHGRGLQPVAEECCGARHSLCPRLCRCNYKGAADLEVGCYEVLMRTERVLHAADTGSPPWLLLQRSAGVPHPPRPPLSHSNAFYLAQNSPEINENAIDWHDCLLLP